MGFQNASENVLHGVENLVIWLWKDFGYILKVVCTNSVYQQPAVYLICVMAFIILRFCVTIQ